MIEDIHWADDATLDLIRCLGRRIRSAPVLVVVTVRTDETPSNARLAMLWADMPRDTRERIELKSLSLCRPDHGPRAATTRRVWRPRQSQVLVLLAEGLSNAEIAERLNTSAKTVEHPVGAVPATLEAPSRLRAVQIARERGIFEN